MARCSAFGAHTTMAHQSVPSDHHDLEANDNTVLFEKILTRSDTNGQGRVVLPKAAAEKHLPPLTNAAGRTIICYDTFGTRHDLQFRFWVNTQSRMYLVEELNKPHGLQHVYNLTAGDVLVFARAHDGRLIVYGRRPTPADKPCRSVKRRIEPAAVEAPRTTEHKYSREPEAVQRCKRQRRPTAKAAAWAAQSQRRQGGSSSGEDEAWTPIQAAWGGAYLSIEEQRKLLPTPVVDGVFRAIGPSIPPPPTPAAPFDHRCRPSHILLRAAHEQGVWLWDAGVWLTTIVMPGVVVQAAFATRAAAEDALAAAMPS